MTPELADKLALLEPLNEEFEKALRTDVGYVLALARAAHRRASSKAA